MRLSYAGSELIQYKSNEVYYESDVVFLKQLSVQEEEPVKWRVQVIMLNILQLWGKMTSMRIAHLVPMEIIFPLKKKKPQPSLKSITWPVAFDELLMNFITVFLKKSLYICINMIVFFLFATSFACLGQRVIYFFGHRTPTEV